MYKVVVGDDAGARDYAQIVPETTYIRSKGACYIRNKTLADMVAGWAGSFVEPCRGRQRREVNEHQTKRLLSLQERAASMGMTVEDEGNWRYAVGHDGIWSGNNTLAVAEHQIACKEAKVERRKHDALAHLKSPCQGELPSGRDRPRSDPHVMGS